MSVVWKPAKAILWHTQLRVYLRWYELLSAVPVRTLDMIRTVCTSFVLLSLCWQIFKNQKKVFLMLWYKTPKQPTKSHTAAPPVAWFWSYKDIYHITGLHKEIVVLMKNRTNYLLLLFKGRVNILKNITVPRVTRNFLVGILLQTTKMKRQKKYSISSQQNSQNHRPFLS